MNKDATLTAWARIYKQTPPSFIANAADKILQEIRDTKEFYKIEPLITSYKKIEQNQRSQLLEAIAKCFQNIPEEQKTFTNLLNLYKYNIMAEPYFHNCRGLVIERFLNMFINLPEREQSKYDLGTLQQNMPTSTAAKNKDILQIANAIVAHPEDHGIITSALDPDKSATDLANLISRSSHIETLCALSKLYAKKHNTGSKVPLIDALNNWFDRLPSEQKTFKNLLKIWKMNIFEQTYFNSAKSNIARSSLQGFLHLNQCEITEDNLNTLLQIPSIQMMLSLTRKNKEFESLLEKIKTLTTSNPLSLSEIFAKHADDNDDLKESNYDAALSDIKHYINTQIQSPEETQSPQKLANGLLKQTSELPNDKLKSEVYGHLATIFEAANIDKSLDTAINAANKERTQAVTALWLQNVEARWPKASKNIQTSIYSNNTI